MSLDLSTQFHFCPYPMYIDPYAGCLHQCSYCYVMRYRDISQIKKDATVESLEKWIKGQRKAQWKFLDWNIPICIGVMSDPLQREAEQKYGVTYEMFKLLKEYNYPFILSTKSDILLEDKYIDALIGCNFVLRVSVTTKSFADAYEKKINNFEKRLTIIDEYTSIAKKVVVRPTLMTQYCDELLEILPRHKKSGVGLVCVMPYESNRAFKFSEKRSNNYHYDYNYLRKYLHKIKDKCDELELPFSSSDCRFIELNSHPACCVGEVEGWRPNKACMNYLRANPDEFEFTEKQSCLGSGACFIIRMRKAGAQAKLKQMSYKDAFYKFFNLED